MKYKNTFNFISQKKETKWIILIILLGFAVRVWWWIYAAPVPVSDFSHYQQLAKSLLEHNYPPSAYRLPMYPVFLAGIMAISNSIMWASFTNVILSTLSIYIIYKLTLSLTSKKTPSLFAAFFYAFNPTFVFFSPVLASEHLFIVLFFLAFLLLQNNYKKKSIFQISKPILAGILFGAATLTRGDGLFFIPVFLILIYLAYNKKFDKYLAIFAFVIAFTITLAPWLIRNHYIVGPGSGLSTTGGINFYFAHNTHQYGWHNLQGTVLEGKSEIEAQETGYQVGLKHITDANLTMLTKDIALGTNQLFFSQPRYSVYWSTRLPRLESGIPNPSKQLEGSKWFYKSTYIYFPLLFVSIASLLFLHNYTKKTIILLYGIVLMNWIGYAVVFWAKARYRYTSEFIFCILAALFLYQTLKYIRGHDFYLALRERI